MASLFFGVLSVSNFKAQAQGKPLKTHVIESKTNEKQDAKNDTINPKIVTGIVSDGGGPLSGVVIKIKGTETFTTTDFEGKYTINVKERDVLVYTFMGLEEVTKTVGNSNVINTVMFESEELKKMIYQVGGA
ncbi:carboxypeptidase-like regulatory domain-containing protein [Flavobacterium oreochromis]|uniref:carboxypeptidase-like regulatory domain-containing protein n=1 Tax=Flavobacterium oreochromis TaxID=2906078 RepID=UPI00385BC5FA